MREMKDRGIEWIGKIPKDWEISKIKYIGKYINGYAFKPNDWQSKGKQIIRIQDLTGTNNNPNYFNGNIPDKYNVKYGDILISWAATLDAFIWKKTDAWLNQHIFKAIPNIKLITKNFFFWLIKVAMINMNNANKHGIVMQHLTLGVFNNFCVPLPSLNKQKYIANYLDDKCSKIDTIIEKQQTIIEKLKEYKMSLITETVTKGLNPNIEMKDSKLQWLGPIPKNWNKFRLSELCNRQITYGIVKMGEYDEKGVKVLRCSDVQQGFIETKNIRTVTKMLSNEYKRTILKGGEIVINVRGTLGGCSIVPDYMAGYNIAREVAIVSIINAIPKFIMYNLLSHTFKTYQEYSQRGSVYIGLNINLLCRYTLFIPPINEQIEIADFLDRKCTTIDSSIQKKQAIIDKLTEYKKSLIYEVVTGKKEI